METVLPPFSPPLLALRAASSLFDEPAHEEEAALLQRARAGEVAALGQLLDEHRDRVLNLAFQILHDREAAEDAAQDAFVRAFSKLNEFRGDARFGTWLFRIALNTCLEKKRGSRPTETLTEDQAVSWPMTAQIESKMVLGAALDALPEALRVALILREWHGQSYEEMAQILRVPIGTVRSRLHEGRLRFRVIWERMEAEER